MRSGRASGGLTCSLAMHEVVQLRGRGVRLRKRERQAQREPEGGRLRRARSDLNLSCLVQHAEPAAGSQISYAQAGSSSGCGSTSGHLPGSCQAWLSWAGTSKPGGECAYWYQ